MKNKQNTSKRKRQSKNWGARNRIRKRERTRKTTRKSPNKNKINIKNKNQ